MIVIILLSLMVLIITNNIWLSSAMLLVLTILGISTIRLVRMKRELLGVFRLDRTAILMVVLRLYIRALSILRRMKVERKVRFNSFVLTITVLLVIRFTVRRFFFFFFFFERVLVPLLMLIVG